MRRLYFKNKNKNFSNGIDYVLLSKFYIMLLKYKIHHPNFNVKKVILKLNPETDWKLLMINKNNQENLSS